VAAAPCVAVAYSGGRDSTALLHATLAAAATEGVQVLALHVHHGLSAHADAWLDACAAQCTRWARKGLTVQFVAQRLDTRPARGESTEAWARQARYRALRTMALDHGASLVLLAHHRRDQAETFVLQALRGAGTAGLAGMPQVVEREGICWARPWLEVSDAQIAAYVRRHRLKYIDDDSNADTRLARNRLRLQVWPALTDAFPQAEAALAAAATWSQEADAALRELAADDLAGIADARGLDVARWSLLSTPRRSNALRTWLKDAVGAAAPASLVTRLLDELKPRQSARWPVAGGELQQHRSRLRPVVVKETAAVRALAPETALGIRRAGRHALPGWGGVLQVTRVAAEGVPLAWLAHLELRPRSGSERFQAGIGRPPRSLKKQFQAAGVAAWERGGPLVYSGGQLVFVPGLGLDARVIGLPGQPQVQLHWLPAERG
jgi:tRNA(Ile)-lysidine synthase